MRVFGLTGGIGCGKSTVARVFARRGVAVIDADQVARDVVAPGTEGLAAVVERFGSEVLAPDGTLDRKRVGDMVFRDAELRKSLESIVIPRIAAESMKRLQALSELGARWALYEAALLVEHGTHCALAGLIVVTAHPSVQRARVMARDHLSAEQAQARIDAQWPLARKVAEARWVVDNSRDIARLYARSEELYATVVLAEGAAWEREVLSARYDAAKEALGS
jgi:dephospho-CoA kinase